MGIILNLGGSSISSMGIHDATGSQMVTAAYASEAFSATSLPRQALEIGEAVSDLGGELGVFDAAGGHVVDREDPCLHSSLEYANKAALHGVIEVARPQNQIKRLAERHIFQLADEGSLHVGIRYDTEIRVTHEAHQQVLEWQLLGEEKRTSSCVQILTRGLVELDDRERREGLALLTSRPRGPCRRFWRHQSRRRRWHPALWLSLHRRLGDLGRFWGLPSDCGASVAERTGYPRSHDSSGAVSPASRAHLEGGALAAGENDGRAECDRAPSGRPSGMFRP